MTKPRVDRRRVTGRLVRRALAVAVTAAVAVAGMAGIAAAKAPSHHPGPARTPAPSGPFGSGTQRAIAASGAPCTIGQVLLSATGYANGVPANGQVLSVYSNAALYSLLGNVFGGEATRGTFALPNLNASAPNGMTYSVCTKGVYPLATDEPIGNPPNSPTMPLPPNSAAFGVDTQRAVAGRGESCALGGLLLTAGRLGNGIPANGQLLSADAYPGLFNLIGYSYGGNGSQFAVPQLQDAAPSGLTYSICAHGVYPGPLGRRPATGRHLVRLHALRTGAGSSPFGTNTQKAVAGNADGIVCTLGDVSLYAAPIVNGTPANGQVVPSNGNQPLYAIIGNKYGGSSPTSFALPKLGLAAPNDMTYAICMNGVFPSAAATQGAGSGRPGDRDAHHGRRRDDDRPGRR